MIGFLPSCFLTSLEEDLEATVIIMLCDFPLFSDVGCEAVSMFGLLPFECCSVLRRPFCTGVGVFQVAEIQSQAINMNSKAEIPIIDKYQMVEVRINKE